MGIKLRGQLVGAGVVMHADGTLVTNYHVVAPAILGRRGLNRGRSSALGVEDAIQIRFYNGRELAAQIHWADAAQDIAVLKPIEVRPGERFASAKEGDSSSLRVGQSVFVVGSPVGLGHSVSAGIVSALDRTQMLSGRATTAIQLDANINFGNSGGPLFDLDGKLVGITTTRSRKGDGIGFAIPIDRVQVLFRHYGKRRRWSHLGAGPIVNQKVAAKIEPLGFRSGVALGLFEKVSASQSAPPNKRIEQGDILVALRGTRFDDLGQGPWARTEIARTLFDSVDALVPGDELDLTVVRNGEVLELSVPILAYTVQEQVRLGAQRVLGMYIELDGNKPPRLLGFVPKAPANRFIPAAQLKEVRNSRIIELQGRPIRGLEDMADILFDLEPLTAGDAQSWVSVVFQDHKNRPWLAQNYPLMMN